MLAELWNDLRYRLRALLRGAALDREMDDEIEAHLAREAKALERGGLTAAAARRQARLAFGGLESVKERSRDERGTRRLEDYLQDAGYAWRRIRRSPPLSITIVALLVLTIGSATVVFSVVNAVLINHISMKTSGTKSARAISASDLTVAVASPEPSGVPNPNVMLEIGYARALRKPVLLLTDAPETLPFDLRTQRAAIYRAQAVGGGEFHRELVSLIAGVVARCTSVDHP